MWPDDAAPGTSIDAARYSVDGRGSCAGPWHKSHAGEDGVERARLLTADLPTHGAKNDAAYTAAEIARTAHGENGPEYKRAGADWGAAS